MVEGTVPMKVMEEEQEEVLEEEHPDVLYTSSR